VLGSWVGCINIGCYLESVRLTGFEGRIVSGGGLAKGDTGNDSSVVMYITSAALDTMALQSIY
jgi:hypothetical protein